MPFGHIPHTIQVWGIVSFITVRSFHNLRLNKRNHLHTFFIFILPVIGGGAGTKNHFIMKKFLLVVAMVCCTSILSAQTKTAYCDVYARGGGQNLKITLMYNESIISVSRTNMGNILNMLAADGWTLDKDVVIPRHPLWSWFTRHKLHLIMKKEHQEGDNPFAFTHIKHIGTTTTSNATDKTNASSSQANNFDTNKSQNTTAVDVSNLVQKTCVVRTSQEGEIEYKGVKAVTVNQDNNQVILVAVDCKSGSWDEAMAYCKSLGNAWTLPSTAEFEKIRQVLTDNAYWSKEEVNEKRAQYYSWGYDTSFVSNKTSNYIILPIAIINKNELK